MAVAGINNVSVLESSYLGESHSSVSRKWGNQERPISRTSFIRKMWRDLEGENRYREIERQQPSGMADGTMGIQHSCSSGGAESECAMINTSEAENECPRDQNQMGLQNGQEDNGNLCLHCSPALGIADKQRVRQVFREWGSKHSSGRMLSGSHTDGCSREKCLCENEFKRVRTVRKWMESSTQQTENGHSDIEEPAPENGYQIEMVRDGLIINHTGIGTKRSICRLYGRQALLDLLTHFERERRKEIQRLLEIRPVSTFAHRNRIQALLRGRFLWNQRFVNDEKSTSIAASELGILRQTQTVSDLRKELLSRLDNYEHIHDGPQSDTSSDNGMNYPQENIEEPPDDIVNEVGTTYTRIDISGTHKVDREIDTCGSPREDAASVEERHELVLEEDGRQVVRPTEFIENRDQDREGSVERNQGAHPVEFSERTLELVCTTQGPPESPSTILDDQDQSNEDELEVHEAFDHPYPSETNADSLSWQEAGVWDEPLTEDDGIEWHHITNTESNEDLDANSTENEDEWYQESAGSDYQESHDGWYDNAMEDATETWYGATSYLEAPPLVRLRPDVFYSSDDGDSNRLELRELMSRRSVSNLLQSDFRVRLDQLIQSYVERQDQASESDDEWMVEREQQDQDQLSVDENVNVTEVLERTEDAHSSQPAISQTHQDDTILDVPDWQLPDVHQYYGTEWEIINGLRTDMILLQERMNNMQRTLEACMNMQLELQRSVQQEISSALNRPSTSGKDSLQKDEPKWDCFLCCDTSFDSSPNRCGDVLVCSKCAEKINWSKLKESIRHP